MNDKDKEAFDDWKNKTQFNFEFQIQGEKIEVPELFKEWCIGGMGVSWQAACEYKQEEYSNIMDAMTQTSQYNYKLQAENKKLREALQSIGYFHLRPEQVIRTAREALKR